MKHRVRRKSKPSKQAETPSFNAPPNGRSILRIGIGIAVVLIAGAATAFFLPRNDDAPAKKETGKNPPQAKKQPEIESPPKNPHSPQEKSTEKEPPEDPLGGSFLKAFGEKDKTPGNDAKNSALNAELEKEMAALHDIEDQLLTIAVEAKKAGSQKAFVQAMQKMKPLQVERSNHLTSIETKLSNARKMRPNDPVPQWLTGELLILIGGYPPEIFPYLNKAVSLGLQRPRLFASVSRTQIEANQFDKAYQSAVKALAMDKQDRYVWKAYSRAAIILEKFDEVIGRLEKTFAEKKPPWAKSIQSDAHQLRELAQVEKKLRNAEAKADNLPRVRLVIRHRRFAVDKNGKALTDIEDTGDEEVIIELFENEAPNTVANFLSLVGNKVYDGTRFYNAHAAQLVAGGDPHSKTGDRADDGIGGPGYAIPDESNAPNARNHFRGSLSMVKTPQMPAGSQFFITVAPMAKMNGQYTVFGRIIKGMDAVDRITLGRTNREVGVTGRLIPGDLILRAEIIRKRDHGYTVKKLPVK